jgi:hypothetical protein
MADFVSFYQTASVFFFLPAQLPNSIPFAFLLTYHTQETPHTQPGEMTSSTHKDSEFSTPNGWPIEDIVTRREQLHLTHDETTTVARSPSPEQTAGQTTTSK